MVLAPNPVDSDKRFAARPVGAASEMMGMLWLINSMMNHIFDVRYEDPFRYILIPEDNQKAEERKERRESITDKVTAYYVEPFIDLGFNLRV